MESNNRDFKNQIEINDLINAAVSDALVRRSGKEETLSDLSREDASNVTGGIKSVTIAGFKPICPPIIVGLIVPPDYEIL